MGKECEHIKSCDAKMTNHFCKENSIKTIDGKSSCKFFNPTSDKMCSTCINCGLDDCRINDTYFCKVTEEDINDIDQHFCDKHQIK